MDAHVEREHDFLRPKLLQPGNDVRRLRHGDAADDDALDPDGQQFVGDGAAAHTLRLQSGAGEEARRAITARLPCEPSARRRGPRRARGGREGPIPAQYIRRSSE